MIRQRHHTTLRLIRLGVLCFLLLLCAQRVGAQSARPYQVKAAFLYNFCRFVDWPANTGSAQFVIAIVGTDPFGSYIDDLTKDEKVAGRPIVVRRFASIEQARGSQIVYLGAPFSADALRGVDLRGTLTVSDTDNFARNGGCVRFFTENNKIRLQINNSAARGAGLSVSAKLLRVSDVIQ